MDRTLFIHSGYRPFNFNLFKKLSETQLNFDFLFVVGERSAGSKNIPHALRETMKYKSLNLRDKKILKNSMGPGLGIIGGVSLFIKLSTEIIKGNHKIIITATEHPLHSKIVFLWARILKKKVIIWTESWYVNQLKSGFLMNMYHCIARYMLKHANAILVLGTAQRNYCKRLGISENKLFIFNYCPSDLSNQVIKTHIKKDFGIENRRVILYVGRIIARKGLDDLIKAFSRLEKKYADLFLLICGDGDYKGYCESLAKALEVKNIKFIGEISSDDVAQFLNSSDIFVLPSKKVSGQIEGWGLVLNEAASMGKPIITTDIVGGALDLVKDSWNGYIVKNGNVDELYKAMYKLILDNDLRKKMGNRSRAIFEEFNDYNKAIYNLERAIEYVRSAE